MDERIRRHWAATEAIELGWGGVSHVARVTGISRTTILAEVVRQLLCRHGLSNEKTCMPPLGTHEWWLPELARELKMPAAKLRLWLDRGWLHGRQTPAQHLWVVWADRDEVKRLRKLVARSGLGVTRMPPELKTPKKWH